MGLNQASAMPDLALKPLDLGPTCVNQGPPTAPAGASSGRAIVQRIDCGGTAMNVQIEVFSPRSTAAPINAERRRLTRTVDADDISETPVLTQAGDPRAGWRFIRGNDPAFVVAAGLWIGGQPTTPGLAMRLHMARTSVTGEPYAPVVLVITPLADWAHVDHRHRRELEQQMSALLDAHPEIDDRVRAMAAAAR